MPRKTKEQKELENEEKLEKKPTKTTKKAASKSEAKTTKSAKTTKKVAKSATTKKTESDLAVDSKDVIKATNKKSSTKGTSKTSDKKPTSKKNAKTTDKKSSTKKTTKATDKKNVAKKISKVATKKSSVSKKTNKVEVVEYYDLPYRYNQTVVKVLAQTPTNLFIYWDISDKDRQNFENHYGEHFFENTRPVLIVHNNTLGYSFEVEINDFANSWYLHVGNSKCDYEIELGRRPIFKTEKLSDGYIFVANSNVIESPNDRILFDKNQKMVYFRNVKTGEITGKTINSVSFIKSIGQIYNIYDLYKAIYQSENMEDYFDLNNPSSGNPSSNSLSSRFK